MIRRVFLAASLLCAICAQATATELQLTNIGLLPGFASSTATSVDNQGEVVGYDTASNGSTEAFYWTQGGGLVGLGGINSEAFGVNNGNVVGVNGNNEGPSVQPFRWTTTNQQLLIIDPGHQGQPNGVNSSGEVIDTRINGTSDRVLEISASNTITNPFSDFTLTGNAINDNGDFVGKYSTNQGYYSDGSNLTLLGNLVPTGLSDTLIAAGTGSLNHLAEYENINTSATTTIGTLGSDTTSSALGIDPQGTWIVGVSNGTGGFLYTVSTSSLQSVTSLLAPSYSGWSILTANSVNDSGYIVGQGSFGGTNEAVLLTAVPEPSGIVLAAAGVLALVARRRVAR